MQNFLIVELGEQVHCIIDTVRDFTDLSKAYSIEKTNNIDCNGFYSFLRKESGKIIGLSFYPFEEAWFEPEKHIQKIEFEYYVFFGKDTEYEKSNSDDTVFYEFYLGRRKDRTCLVFDISFLDKPSFEGHDIRIFHKLIGYRPWLIGKNRRNKW